jgi:hypothetical protein
VKFQYDLAVDITEHSALKATDDEIQTIKRNKPFRIFYCCTVHFDNIKILFTKECTLYCLFVFLALQPIMVILSQPVSGL